MVRPCKTTVQARRDNFTICICKHNRSPNSQNNLEKEVQSWRNQAPSPQTLLQSYSDQNSMALAQKQTHRSVE